MESIFKETRPVGPLPTTGAEGASVRAFIAAEVRAVYDDRYGILCVDMSAAHTDGCPDDGTPRGCRACAPFFPREERKLVDVSNSDRAGATRLAIGMADDWYRHMAQLAQQAAARGPIEGT